MPDKLVVCDLLSYRLTHLERRVLSSDFRAQIQMKIDAEERKGEGEKERYDNGVILTAKHRAGI